MNWTAPLSFLKRLTDNSSISVRAVTDAGELQKIYALTHDCYVSKGYCDPQPDGLLPLHNQFDILPETTVLVAEMHGQIVGSVSIIMDGPQGFPFEKEFHDIISQLRLTHTGLAAISRLVVHKAARANLKIVKALIKALFVVFQNSGGRLKTGLLTVNPSHEKIYQKLLNMTSIARSNAMHGLSNAPAVLLRCNLDAAPANWREV
jgi:hypothetical protein